MNSFLLNTFRILKFSILSISILSNYKVLADERAARLQIDAKVAPFCSIEANPLTFHKYTSVSVTSSTSIIVKCTNGTNYSIALSNGSNSSNNENRNMRLNSNLLNYQLYREPAMKIVWGDNSTNSLVGVGTGVTQIYKVYGLVPANQIGQAGIYNDSLLVNINMLDPRNDFGNLSNYQMMVRMNVSVDKL